MGTHKDIRGNWCVTTEVTLVGEYKLRIVTHRVSSGNFVCTASVVKRTGACFEHNWGRDYQKMLGCEKFRGSERAVAVFHEWCINSVGLDTLINEATLSLPPVDKVAQS